MSADPTPAIRCTGLRKQFDGTVVLDGLDLDVAAGTILGLLGPSGSGKTTALRVIAGFERPDAGSVEIAGRVMVGRGTWVPPERRRVGMVFQDYALFPHLSVATNVGYGVPGPGQDARVDRVLEMVGLGGAAGRYPHELSGGEQQRVALARALAPEPDVVLLDEPFSNLDAPRRDRVRREVRTILTEARATAVLVTHDQEEALATGDSVAVMRRGRIVQVDEPGTLYRRPSDCWVARFLGEAEFVPGTAASGEVDTPLGRFEVAPGLHGPVEVMIRPESVQIVPGGDDADVVAREYYGHDQLVTLRLSGGRRLLSRIGPYPPVQAGDRVGVRVREVVAFEASDGHGHRD
jgi:iron(III) transport system ATP-binding protein